MTFREWLDGLRVRDTPRGDFIADVRRDPAFGSPDSEVMLTVYLQQMGACREAISEGRKLWKEYERITRVPRGLYEERREGS